MNRDEARTVWREVYRRLAPTFTPELAGEHFDEWWAQTETAMERGNRIHKEFEDGFKTRTGSDDKWRSMMTGIGGVEAARPIMQIHDEIMFEVATNAIDVSAWRCQNRGCPSRAPVYAGAAPKCYTCDQPMLRYWVPTMDPSIRGVKEAIEREFLKISDAVGKLPLRVDPNWGPSPLKKLYPIFREPGETDASLRERIRAYTSGEKLEIAPRYGKTLMHDLINKDPCETALEIARGEQLDMLGEQLGLRRRPAEFQDHTHSSGAMMRECVRSAEPDDEYRERILATRRQTRATGEPIELASARHAVGMHKDVARVDVMCRNNAKGEPQVYVEAAIFPDRLTNALNHELQERLAHALPAGTDWRLDLVYSTT